MYPSVAHDGIRIVAALHPASTDADVRFFPEGGTLAEMLEAVSPGATSVDGLRVFVGCKRVAREDWGTTRPGQGAHVVAWITPATGDGDTDKVLRSVLFIGVTALSLGVGATSAFWGGAIALGGQWAVNALVPPPSLETSDAPTEKTESTPSLSGSRNRLNTFGPVPAVFGVARITPPLAALPYTELDGSDQYLRELFTLGYGPLQIWDIKIGETPITNYTDVEIETVDGDSGAAAMRLFPGTVVEEQVGVLLAESTGWVTRRTETGVDEIGIEMTFPRGLVQVNADGTRSPKTVAFDAEYKEVGAGVWSELGDTLDVPSRSFEESHFTPYRISRIVVDSYNGRVLVVPPVGGETTPTIPTGTYSVAVVIRSSILEITDARDAALTTYGAGDFLATNDPDVDHVKVAAGKLDPIDGFTQTAKSSSAIRVGQTIQVESGQYDVRIKRTTADSVSDVVFDEAFWTVMRSITDDDPVSLTGLAKVALRIKATDQLQGVVDTFSCLARCVIPDWDSGTSAWVARETSNPASAYRRLLQGPMNHRPLADARLDLPALQAWHDWCDANGAEFNGVIDFKATLHELLRDVASVGRASPTMRDGRFSVVQDVAQATPRQLFTPKNSSGFAAQRAFAEPVHALKVQFIRGLETHEVRVTPANVEVGDVFTLKYNDVTQATFTATVANVANVVTGLKAAWDASTEREAGWYDATDDATHLTLLGNRPSAQLTFVGETNNSGEMSPWTEVAGKAGGTETWAGSVVVYNGKVYVGTGANGELYEWNGVDTLVRVAPQLGVPNYIYSLCVYNNKIYGGTNVSGELYEWNGVNLWVSKAGLFHPASTIIYDLAVYNGKLYGCTNDGRLLEWNDVGAWAQKAAPLGGQAVECLHVFNGHLYAGTSPNGRLLEWNDVNAWVVKATQFGAETHIRDMEVLGSKLYGGSSPGGRLLEWNDVNAWVEVAAQFGAEVVIASLLVFDGYIYGGTGPNGMLLKWTGAAWTQQAPKLGAETGILQMALLDEKIYAGTNPGARLYRSIRGGTDDQALAVAQQNADGTWERDEIVVYDDGYDVGNASKFSRVSLIGVANPDQAWRAGRYYLAVRRLRPETFSLTVDVENIVCSRGDLVRVQHDVPLIGLSSGRVKSLTVVAGNVTTITLDEAVTMFAGTSYAVRFRQVDMTVDVEAVDTAPGETTTLTFSGAVAVADAPAVGDLVAFGEAGSETAEMIVQQIEMGPDLSAKLTLVDAAAAVHTADTGTIPAYSPTITSAPRLGDLSPAAPEIVNLRSDVSVMIRHKDGTFENRILATIRPGSGGGVPATRYEAQFKQSSLSAWIELPDTPADATEISVTPVADYESYDVRVRAVSAWGVTSAWVAESDHVVAGASEIGADWTGVTDVALDLASGTMVNAMVSVGVLYAPLDLLETWDEHFSTRGWASIQDQIDAGYPHYAQPSNPTAGSWELKTDLGGIVYDALLRSSITLVRYGGDVAVTPTINTSPNDVDWTAYAGSDEVYATGFRYVKVKYEFDAASLAAFVATSEIRLDVDAKTRIDSDVAPLALIDVGGTQITFSVDFLKVTAIISTPVDAVNSYSCDVNYNFATLNPTTFKVALFDENGNRVDGECSYIVRGY